MKETMKNVAAILLLFSTAACANEEKASVGKYSISLDSAQCSVKFSSSESLQLTMKPSCFFVKNSAGEIRREYFADIKAHVFVIVGTSVKNHKDFPLTKTRNDCGTELQAIILPEQGKPKLSKVQTDTITCAGVGVDKKEYWILSH